MFNRKFAGSHAGKIALCALLAASLNAHAQAPAPVTAKPAANAAPQPAPSAQSAQPVQSQAAQPAAHAISREAAEIASINERIAVMSARFAELEMQAKISAKRAEIDKSMASGKAASSVDETFIPSVREISGIDGRIWAILNVQNGNTQTVRVGDKVGGWRVAEIQSDSVTVRKGAETVRLSFGLDTPQPQSAQATAGVPGALPPFPTR